MKLDFDSYSVESKPQKVKGKFINREISWLQFNNRVLCCANNKELPLNERLKFLAISCSNLDEFIAVRYAGIDNDIEPKKKILDNIIKCMELQFTTYQVLRDQLKKEGINICKINELDKKEKSKLEKIYHDNIFPMLTPINIGSTNEIPIFYSGQNCICATIKSGGIEKLVIIPINKNLENMYVLGKKVIMIEDIILYYLKDLFINKEISSSGYFRVIKDASVILNHDESKFLLDRMISTLEERNMANPIFLQVSKSTPKRLRNILISVFGVESTNIFTDANILDYTRFMNHTLLNKEKYSFKPFEPYIYETVEETHSLFSAIRNRDILLHHPYDSYDTVVKFIEHASIDPKVVAIKQTLYRVSSEDSPIVNALCKAARMGKSVSVLIEIKARFDEQRNISLINKLERCGVNVLLGLEYLKTHCKMCIVIRKENSKLEIYSHVGTGNYNEKTARQYTDISYLTSKQKIGMDLLHVFNILSGISTPDEKLQKVFYAPVNLRKKLIKNIDREIEYAKKGKKAEIFLKLNSINDIEIINKLYEAGNKGVKIYILSRGITSIVAKKNIFIKSIVGRFLEHSRIYYFRNNNNPEYYISSADMLTRNLDKRVEILLLINDSMSIKKLKEIISIFKADTKNSFKMNENGEYKYLNGKFDCHQWFIDNSEKNIKIKIPEKK